MVTGALPPALRLRGLTRRFGGIAAVSEVTFDIEVGARHGIIGPNGAGKTTLFNMISGELGTTSGSIELFGRDVTHVSAPRRVAQGLGRTYQITRIFPRLTVRQNLAIAFHGLRSSKFSMLKPWMAYGQCQQEIADLAAGFLLDNRLESRAGDLSHGEQRQLEVALALALKPRVLLLDEPAAGLSPGERVGIRSLLQRLPSGLTLVMIEHDMDIVRDVVDRIEVLDFGQLVAQGSTADIRANPRVRQIYLGSRS